MALIENTDFSQKQQVDMAAIASLYQKKAAMEAEMKVQKEQIKASKQQRLMDVMNMAASMSTKMIDARAAKQQKDAQQNVFDTLAMTDKSINKAIPVPAGQEGPMQMEQVRFGDTPQFKTQLETGLAKAFPKEYGEQKIKSLLGSADGNKTMGGRYQQSQLQIPDPLTGQMKTYSVTFDRETGQNLNPQSGQPIMTEKDLDGLLERGYAQNMRPAGYTLDGQEVVADQRTGNKYIISADETGKQSQKKYGGVIYPKLENAPAAAQEALTNLQVSRDTLASIQEKYQDEFVGPVASRYKTVSQYVNTMTDEQQTAFKTELKAYQNATIKAITGAQMSEPEAKRLLLQMPDDTKSPKAFIQQLKVNEQQIQRQVAARLRVLEEGRNVFGKPVDETKLRQMIDKKFNIKSSDTSDLSSMSTEDLFKQLGGN